MTEHVLVRVNNSSLTLSHLSLQLHSQSGVTMLTFSPSFRASFTYSEEVDNGYENDEFTLAVPSLAAISPVELPSHWLATRCDH